MSPSAGTVAAAVGYVAPPDYRWTEEIVSKPLKSADLKKIVETVEDELAGQHVTFDDQYDLIRRCAQALLVGHLVLKGPPGTGKTTLTRALAKGFSVNLTETTATSDWTPFHLVGGFRPTKTGGLAASHGKAVEAVLNCAADVRSEQEQPQATWLLIDEFNRADIDKAMGSLFTVLSTCDPSHLLKTPIDLWFESAPAARKLWVPARFRIIAAMNDLDTAFVNRMSQGLTRRFQFITVPASRQRGSDTSPVSSEIKGATAAARQWLEQTYSAVGGPSPLDELTTQLQPALVLLQKVIDGLRQPDGSVPGWPVGTAQIVDVLRLVLLVHTVGDGADIVTAVDDAVANRLIPQMTTLDDQQHTAFGELLNRHKLVHSATELTHMVNPHNAL